MTAALGRRRRDEGIDEHRWLGGAAGLQGLDAHHVVLKQWVLQAGQAGASRAFTSL